MTTNSQRIRRQIADEICQSDAIKINDELLALEIAADIDHLFAECCEAPSEATVTTIARTSYACGFIDGMLATAKEILK